jgi:hypothetical protein
MAVTVKVTDLGRCEGTIDGRGFTVKRSLLWADILSIS